VATERGQEAFDALLDIVVADELRTGLRPPIPESEADWELKADVWRDPRTVVGGSDAGAHLDVMCGAIYSTSLLGEGVRKRHLLSWEEAVHQLTDIPARLYGLRHRGRLTPGPSPTSSSSIPTAWASSPSAPGRPARWGQPVLRRGRRHRARPGERHRDRDGGSFTGALPGAVLRSGRDTDTVTVPGASGGVMTPAPGERCAPPCSGKWARPS
jgi:hypothetical protein